MILTWQRIKQMWQRRREAYVMSQTSDYRIWCETCCDYTGQLSRFNVIDSEGGAILWAIHCPVCLDVIPV